MTGPHALPSVSRDDKGFLLPQRFRLAKTTSPDEDAVLRECS